MSKSFFESRNPVFNEEKLQKLGQSGALVNENISDVMSISGAINKTAVLFIILLATSVASYAMPSMFLLIVGIVGGLIAVLVASFKPHTSAIAAPVVCRI